MENQLLLIVTLLGPAVLLFLSLAAIVNQKLGRKIPSIIFELAGLVGIALAIGLSWSVFQNGIIQTDLLGWEGLGLSLRLDALSMTMFTMIAILAFVVLRFSNNYLEGDRRKNIFMARMATTIASVELLVLSGNLLQLLILWVITSVCLHYLLVFYRNRPQAIAAARKKFIVARLGDLALLAATLLIYFEIGSGDIGEIFAYVQNVEVLSNSLIWATIFIVITAALKSAQFPTHGWLVKVVETPTPVSALLHAGLLNAGPFLIVRMSFLMSESTAGSILLIIIAGFTALFASVVFLTQSSVKVGLGYSSIAHMGFSLLICGFGVYSAAILHVVAHSFYKAHSFLSTGSVIDSVRARKVLTPKRIGSIGRIGLSILTSLSIYALFLYIWGIDPAKEFNLMATGAIIIMGLSQVISSALDSKASWIVVAQTAGLALFIALCFFTFEHGASVLLASQIPTELVPTFTIKSAVIVVLALYSLVILAQLFSPIIGQNKYVYQLGVHVRNGLYANVIFDRIIGSLKNEQFEWANLTMNEEKIPEMIQESSDVKELQAKDIIK